MVEYLDGNQIQNITQNRMHRKYSHSIKLKQKNFSFNAARKIYSSNKALKEKEQNLLVKKCSCQSMNKINKCQHEGRCKRFSFHEKKNVKQNPHSKNNKPYILPTLKFIESQTSTAEDLMQKINSKLNKQSSIKSDMKCFMTMERANHIKQRSRVPTVSYQNNTNNSQNQKSKRKVFQCKIIRSPKIPFPFPMSVDKRRKFSSLIADTEDISQIKIYPAANFVSPESQYLIDF